MCTRPQVIATLCGGKTVAKAFGKMIGGAIEKV